jgi:hypothetical protein
LARLPPQHFQLEHFDQLATKLSSESLRKLVTESVHGTCCSYGCVMTMVKIQTPYDSNGDTATPDKTAMTMLSGISSPEDETSSRTKSPTLQKEMEDPVLSRILPQESLVVPPSSDTPPSLIPAFSRSQYSASASISWLRENYTCSVRRRAALGAVIGGLLSLAILAICAILDADSLNQLCGWYVVPQNNSNKWRIRGERPPTGISNYLSLFPKRTTSSQRRLADLSSSSGSSSSSSSSGSNSGGSYKDPQLVIAGKMSVEEAPCNIAQFNLKTQEWSLTERIQLSLYNSYSGGEVYSLLANHTNQVYDDSAASKDTTR